MKKKFSVPVLILLTGFTLFGVWYNYKYSMDTAVSFEVNNNAGNPNLLIATQGSQYKNLITEGIIEALKSSKMYIKMIDVSGLKATNAAEWDCILIAHTWEIGTPPKAVSSFINSTHSKNKIITLATSGDGGNRIKGVDAITSASVIENVDDDVNLLLMKINKILGVEGIAEIKE